HVVFGARDELTGDGFGQQVRHFVCGGDVAESRYGNRLDRLRQHVRRGSRNVITARHSQCRNGENDDGREEAIHTRFTTAMAAFSAVSRRLSTAIHIHSAFAWLLSTEMAPI